MLTVKQLADKLKVSKQTINNNVPNDMSYKKINNINYIDEQLEIAITNNIEKNKNRFSYDNNAKQSETTTTNEDTSTNDELIKLLREQLEIKDKQLEVKDKQIEQITQALTNQQLLHREASNNNQLSNTDRDTTENKNSNVSEATYSVHTDTDNNTTERSSSTTNNNGSVSNNVPNNTDISQEQSSITKETDTDINNSTPPKKKGILSRLFNR
jgi:transcriptional regulator with XRE-family HTH domain